MIAKSLFIILLGSTLILASPVQEVQEKQVNRSILGTFANWLHKADEAVASTYERVKKPFEKIYQMVVETGEGVVGYGKEKVHQVLQKYYELKRKSEENINQVKNAFLMKVINELQTVIDTLTNETDGDTLEKLQEKTKEIAKSGKEALEKLQQQLQEAIDTEKAKLDQNLDKWQYEADQLVKKRDS